MNTQNAQNRDRIREAFKNTPIKTRMTTDDIKHKLKTAGMEPSSILPADYCYNRTNKNFSCEKTEDAFCIFEYIRRGEYQYLGENHPYTGPVIHNPKGSTAEKVVGHYKNGKYYPAETV